MGEGESDTPRAERFSSRDEEREFRPAVERDPHVQRAVEIMSEHADRLNDEPESPAEVLLDELVAERKKERPDPKKLANIHRRMTAEGIFVAAQSVQELDPKRYEKTLNETAELNRLELLEPISVSADEMLFYDKDTQTMANTTLDDGQDYPESIAIILNEQKSVEGKLLAGLSKLFRFGKNTSIEEVLVMLADKEWLQKVDMKTLVRLRDLVEETKQEFIAVYEKMYYESFDWNEQHRQSQ